MFHFGTYFFTTITSIAAYEIWFKQILYEIDSVRELFLGKANMDRILENIAKGLKDTSLESPEEGSSESTTSAPAARRKKREDMCSISEDAVHHHEVDDAHMLEINKRLNRVVMILKVFHLFSICISIEVLDRSSKSFMSL